MVPPGADARHKEVHLAVGVLPDLGAGELWWAAGLAGLSNWPGMKEPGISAASCSAPGNGSAHPFAALGQHQFGAVCLHQQPALHAHGLGHDNDDPVARAAATLARPMPVLPEVGSMITAPGPSRPRASASSSMALATRSLTEPPGLKASSWQGSGPPAIRSARCGSAQQGRMPDQLVGGCIIWLMGIPPVRAGGGPLPGCICPLRFGLPKIPSAAPLRQVGTNLAASLAFPIHPY